MSIKALITTLILGSSSVAFAAPSASFTAQARWTTGPSVVAPPAPTVRDHRPVIAPTTPYAPARGMRAGWIALGEPMQLDRGRAVIRLDQATRVTQLRIQNIRGSSRIAQVTVAYTDGTRQVIKLDRRINPRNAVVDVNLSGSRPIASVIINGSSARGGTYQVLGYGTKRPVKPPVYQPPRRR